MSRPIAYNASGPLSGSIRGGSVNYTVDSGNRDYTTFASKKWVPSADGVAPIVFVTDSYTQGITNQATAVPLFYSCNGTGSAAIIYTANRVPGSPGNYTDANVALNDLITARGYFILESNDPFEGINADNLAFDVDASKMSSYPQTGTNWRDLSGKGTNGTLTNGPTWNSNGYFTFDATDDYVNFPNDTALNSNSITVSSTFNPTSVNQNGFLFEKGYVNTQYALFFENPTFKLRFLFNSLGYQDFQINASSYMTAGRWYNAIVTYDSSVAKMYINGTLVNQATYNDTIQVNNNGERIGAWYDGGVTGYYFNGSISNTQVYPRALTEAQVKQNYFGSPIVTDGLVFAVDANNIVSYPKSGTSWYNLTGSNIGTLINGPVYNPSNGGSILFDGTDDYISTNFTQTFADEITIECWYKGTKSARNHLWTLGRYSGNTNLTADFNDSGTTLWIYWNGGGSPAIRYISPNFTDNTIKHLVYSHSGSVNKTYLNGELLTPYDVLGTQTFSPAVGGAMEIGSVEGTQLPFGGNVYSYRVYNKGLTASEVLQNYQAEQYRFETPSGPVTNGLLLYWDAGNLDSYPGTGTTIYDLSGNGNNGTLYNGVGFNQTNGGVLTFDGIDDYVRCTTPNLAGTNYTAMGASRYVSITSGYQRIINASGNNWLLGHWGPGVNSYYAQGWINNPTTTDTNWRIYTGNGDISGDSYGFYINNSLVTQNNGGSAGPVGIVLGDYGQSIGTEPSNSQFSFVLLYNRILTAAEMTQNYNYFKGRFGL